MKKPIILLTSLIVLLFSFKTIANYSTSQIGDNPPLFYGDFCTMPGDNRCFITYMKEELYALPNRCDGELKGKYTVMFTISKRGKVIHAELAHEYPDLCDYWKNKIILTTLKSPLWVPAQKEHEKVEHTMSIILEL